MKPSFCCYLFNTRLFVYKYIVHFMSGLVMMYWSPDAEKQGKKGGGQMSLSRGITLGSPIRGSNHRSHDTNRQKPEKSSGIASTLGQFSSSIFSRELQKASS